MSYGTNDGFTDYFTARGVDTSDMTDAQITAARQVGTDYVDGKYGACFVGRRTDGYDQDDEWPRAAAITLAGSPVPSDVVPKPIVYAAYEAGWADYNSPGTLTPTVTTSDRKVLTKVDVIGWTVIGKDSPDALRPVLVRVEDLLAPFVDCESIGKEPYLGVI